MHKFMNTLSETIETMRPIQAMIMLQTARPHTQRKHSITWLLDCPLPPLSEHILRLFLHGAKMSGWMSSQQLILSTSRTPPNAGGAPPDVQAVRDVALTGRGTKEVRLSSLRTNYKYLIHILTATRKIRQACLLC